MTTYEDTVREQREYAALCDQARSLHLPVSLDDPRSPRTVDGLRQMIRLRLVDSSTYTEAEHECRVASVEHGGDLKFVAHYAAPGHGEAWACRVCDESFARVGGGFYPASERMHEMQPEDVI